MSAHIPVLHTTVLDVLAPREGEMVLDATLGLGGHAAAFLGAIGPSGHLIGLDADSDNLASARERIAPWQQQVELHHANFRAIADLGFEKVDILFADLGLSSPHVDEPERGFTFRADAPLDMRFDRSQGQTAADLIESSTEKDLSEILFRFGEVRNNRKIAQALKTEDIQTTFDVRRCVEQVCGHRAISVLPQVFQALRIAVNDELGALEVLLEEGPKLLSAGGRLGIISYHSLEDRMVKQAFRSLTTPEKDEETGQDRAPAPFELITKKPIVPSEEEIAANPRARSARFRAIRRAILL